MKSNNNPVARRTDVVVQELGEEVLVYNLQNNKAFCLNETSALVWKLCDGTNSVSDIQRLASQQVSAPVPADMVWLAIDGLRKENLLESSDNIPVAFEGMTRREVMKKVGLATVVALPIVSSLVAPAAAQAQSCAAPGDPCGAIQCCTGICEGICF